MAEHQGGIRYQWYKGWDRFQTYLSTPFRDRWNRKLEFVLTCLGYCIGFGNIWRFPYEAHTYGGGAFFLPYIIVLFLLALPIFYLETLLGQFSGCNPVSAFSFAPACKGIAIASLVVCIYTSLYYIMFMVYASKYFFASFSYELPWTRCKREWPKCIDFHGTKSFNRSSTPTVTELYWQHSVLHTEENFCKENGIEHIGSVQWDLFGLLLLSWLIQYMFLFRGIKSSGKLVYFTATFPLLVMLILLCYSLSLDGAIDGLNQLFIPDWSKVMDPSVWHHAAIQAFYSTGVSYGCLILYSSYNDFNYPVEKIAILIVLLDLFGSLCSSITVFSVLGYLAKSLKVDVKSVTKPGADLIFKVMPQAIATMRIPQLWSVLYFAMIYNVGIDSQAAMVELIITVAYEEIAILKNHKGKVRCLVCILLFLLSVPCTTKGGFCVVEFLNLFSADIILYTIGLSELLAVMVVYGYRKFVLDVAFMTTHRVNLFWKTTWLACVPVFLIILFTLALFRSTVCDNYKETVNNFCVFGWFIEISCLIPIPLVLFYQMCKYKRIEDKKVKNAFMPHRSWGPRDILNKILYLQWQKEKGKMLDPKTNAAIAQLQAEVDDELPNVEAVVRDRVAQKKMSIFHRFSTVFRPGEVAALSAKQKKREETPLEN